MFTNREKGAAAVRTLLWVSGAPQDGRRGRVPYIPYGMAGAAVERTVQTADLPPGKVPMKAHESHVGRLTDAENTDYGHKGLDVACSEAQSLPLSPSRSDIAWDHGQSNGHVDGLGINRAKDEEVSWMNGHAVADTKTARDTTEPDVDAVWEVTESNGSSVLSCDGWTDGARQRFASPHAFFQSVASWADNVPTRPPLSEVTIDGWCTGDVEWDAVMSGYVRHPLEAPRTQRDVSVLDDDAAALRRATQTANSASLLLACAKPTGTEVWQQHKDGPDGTGPLHAETHERPAAADRKDVHRVRAALERDAERIASIYNDEIGKGMQAPDGIALVPTEVAHLITTQAAYGLPLLVATDSTSWHGVDEVVGFALLSFCDVRLPGLRRADDRKAHVFVDRRFRQRGYGSALFEQLMRTATVLQRCDHVYVDLVCGNVNGLAEQQYRRVLTQRFGFVMLGEFQSGRVKAMRFGYRCAPPSPPPAKRAAKATGVDDVWDGLGGKSGTETSDGASPAIATDHVDSCNAGTAPPTKSDLLSESPFW